MASSTPANSGQTIVIYTQSTLSRLFGWIGWAGFLISGLLLLSLSIAFSDYFDTTGGIEERRAFDFLRQYVLENLQAKPSPFGRGNGEGELAASPHSDPLPQERETCSPSL